MGDIPVRFHQSIAFLPTSQVRPRPRASDELGYGGIYVSDHIFNPRTLASRYTYSVREDGAPGRVNSVARRLNVSAGGA